MIADTINYAVSYADCKQNNEVPEFQFLRIELPKNTQGLSPLSSDSLYLRTQTSIPCAKLAKSLFSTFSFRYSYISGGNVTVNEILLRAMHLNRLHKILNMCNLNMCIASDKGAGSSKNESNKPISERAERNGWKFTIIQHRGSGRKIRQYPVQNNLGVLQYDGKYCEGRDRKHDVGALGQDLRSVVREVSV